MSCPSAASRIAANGSPRNASLTSRLASGRSGRRHNHPRSRLLPRLPEKRRAHSMLHELPELLTIGDASQEADGDTEPTLVAPTSAVRASLLVRAEGLLEPRRRVDA